MTAASPSCSDQGEGLIARLAAVHHRYGDRIALHGLDLTLRPGEVLALLGANGAGKSTALGLLTGRLRPQQGEVMLCGGDPRDAASRRFLGAMLQEARLPETLRVGELVRQFSAAYPAPRPFAETMAMAGVADLAQRPYGDLSGGQQRRVQFALAICGRPRVVLVDEPTTGLDAAARRAFWAVMRSLRLDGVALLLTTHYLEEADALADRIMVLQGGRVVAEGSPMQLKARWGGTRVRCQSRLPASEVASWPGVLEVVDDGPMLVMRCTDADAFLRRLLAADPGVSRLDVQPASLEDSVIGLTEAPRGSDVREASAA